MAPAVWSCDLATGEQSFISAPDLVANIVLGEAGTLVATLSAEVSHLDLQTSEFSPIVRAPGFTPSTRLNDGKTDRLGRLLTGSMGHAGQGEPTGQLFRFDRGAAPEVLASGIGISNAICFSPAGDRLYFADSLRQLIWTYPYDLTTGAVGPRVVLIDTAPLGSAPDGATVDAQGRLWVALVESAQIACIKPSGQVERLIDLPIPYPSCPAFGGERLDTLFVTSISDSGGRLRTDHPDGGRLIAITGLDAEGLAETRCRL
jgi:sugar lactone lactonase YvrE